MIRHVLNTLGFRRSTLAVVVGVPFLVAVSAFAQAPAGGEAVAERVIVTGSYIPTAETESALPVTVYTAEVLQKQGANTPVEGLRQLPAFIGNAATENDSNGGNGQAGINLRSIGQANVLVMINGRRAFLGTGINLQADINAIPIGAIDRSEILKDGSSAIYGSDAVAGVVNFIMLNGPGAVPYEGAEVFMLYGNTTETDAHVRQVYLRGGVKTDKVAIAAEGEYYSRANLFSRDRSQLAGSGNLTGGPFGPPNADPNGLNPPGPGALGRGGLNNNSPTYAGRVSILNNITLPGGRIIGGQLVLQDLNNATVAPASYRRFEPNYPGSAVPSNPPGGTQAGDFPPGTDPSRFNFRAFTPAIPAVEKAMYYITGRYKIFGDGLQIYGDILYAKTKQDNGLAASPFSITSAANGRNEARASLFNPFGNNLGSVRYRLVNDLGPRRSFYDHDYYRYVAGLNGDFNFKDNAFISHFGYDTGIVYERFDELRTDSGDATRTDIRRLIAANVFDPFIGQFAPVTGLAPEYVGGVATGRMIPYDNRVAGNLNTVSTTVPHVAAGGAAVTNIAENGAAYVGHSAFRERDWLADAKINAHLFPNMYNGGLDFALGYEHRELAQHSFPDPVQAAGDQLGFNQSPNTKTLQKVDSIFTELNFPIVTSTMNVPFVRSFELSIAWRYEKFTDKDQYTHATASFKNKNPDENFGGSPRLSLRYQPIPDLTLRANWNQSFRSPTPANLFSPTVQDFPQLFDPVVGVTLQPPDGVWRSGSTNVTPELTDSYSAGLVYTPKWLPGFTFTADFYQLYTQNLILGGNDFAQVLLSTGFPDVDGCGKGSGAAVAPGGPALGITRNPDGTLDCIDSQVGNAGNRFVEGIDVTAVYEIPTQNWGNFTFSLGWNHFFSWKAGLGIPGFELHNFLGDYNNGTFPLAPGAVPFNKGFLRFEWAGNRGWMKGFDFIATMNYIGDYEDDPSFIFGNFQIGGTLANPSYALHHRVSDYETLDLQLSYEFLKPEPVAAAGYSKDAKDAKSMGKEVAGVENSTIWQRMLWNTKITLGVNNAFDRYPPTVLGAFNDNYDTSTYSIRNRYWYVSLNKKF